MECVVFAAKGDLQMNYYSESCPRAEDIIKEQVIKLYEEHGNTAVSWLRNLFHDCMVKVCIYVTIIIHVLDQQ